MIVAVTYENGNIFQHFGRTEQFKLYSIENGKIEDSKVVDTNGVGHGALAGLLASMKAEALICGGIGPGAQNALAEAGIKVFPGASGDADAAAQAFADGNLAFDPDAQCRHHGSGHQEGHDCASHATHGCHSGGCH